MKRLGGRDCRVEMFMYRTHDSESGDRGPAHGAHGHGPPLLHLPLFQFFIFDCDNDLTNSTSISPPASPRGHRIRLSSLQPHPLAFIHNPWPR